MQCCCVAPRERQPAAAPTREPAALVLYEGVPPVSPSRRGGGGGAERAPRDAVPRHGVRLGYLSELAQQAEALPFPLTAVEADGTPRVVPSYEAFTCRDLCEFVVLPMTQSAGADGGSCSACELLRQGSRQSVHGATRMVSYAWQYTLADLLAALSAVPAIEDHWLWIDMLTMDQSAGGVLDGGAGPGEGGGILDEHWLEQFQDLVRGIGHTLVVLDSWTLPVPPTRSWCCLEGFVTASVGATLEIALPPSQKAALRSALIQGRFDEVHHPHLFKILRPIGGGFIFFLR